MATEVVTMTKEEKHLEELREEAAKAAKLATEREVKRVADERAATKAHLDVILLLRGLARALSPHGAEDLAGALDAIANALASGKKLDDPILLEVAIALKNSPNDWAAMVKKINDLLRPVVLPDRSVLGVLRAVENSTVTIEQAQELLGEKVKVA